MRKQSPPQILYNLPTSPRSTFPSVLEKAGLDIQICRKKITAGMINCFQILASYSTYDLEDCDKLKME